MTAGAPAGEVVKAGGVIRGREGAHYEVVRPLGHGGMAEVWLARRVSADGFTREVALKCVTPGLDAEERVRRMCLAEAQLAGRLSHPNIAEAFALERIGDRHYLVLEYVRGASVSEVLEAARRDRRSLSEGFCCHVVASVAEALDYVHALAGADGQPLGIVHRDVKAANIMVAASGAVKLLDFGVAYSRIEGRDRTRTGTVKGTCGYFSPEQAEELAKEEGRDELLDGRSDLFALGVLLVELLTGERPFEAGNDLRTVHKIAECDVGEVEKATENVPAALRNLCRKALAKKPAQRFQTGGELAVALRRHLVEHGVLFGMSECSRELRGLDLGGAGEGQSSATVTGAWSGRSEWTAEGAVEPPGRVGGRRWSRVWLVVVLAVVLAGGLLAGGRVLLEQRRSGGRRDVPPAPGLVALASAPVVQEEVPGRCEAAPGVPESDAVAGTSGKLPAELVVVRPKKTRDTARQATDRGGKKPPETASTKVREEESAKESRKARSVVSTLARGTLIPAKVVGAIDAANPGTVEAVVAEDVVSGGSALVPRGSALRCSSRRGQGERVELSCGGIRTPKGDIGFSGMAVEGGRLGLRVVDGAVAPGTSFLVYVSAAAAW